MTYLLSAPKNIKVSNLLNGKVTITWNSKLGATGYNIYRNYLPYGTFTKLNSTPILGNSYTDTDLKVLYEIDPYYSISAINVYGEGERSYPYTHDYIQNFAVKKHFTDKDGINVKFKPGVFPLPSNLQMEYYMNEIRRRNIWLLEQDGSDAWLLKRKQPEVDNEESEREYGRRTEYWLPAIKIKVRFISIEETKSIKEYGLYRKRAPRSWTIWTPLLHNKDIIIDRQNRRLEVTNVTPHYWRELIVMHQDFDLIEIEKTDEIYKVALPSAL